MGLPVSSIQRALGQHVLIVQAQCLRAGGCTEGGSQHTPSLALAGKEGYHTQWLYQTKTSQGRVALRSRHLNVSNFHLNLNSHLEKPSHFCR